MPYRAKVARLRESLAHPGIRDKAIGILRGLITGVRVRFNTEGWKVEVQGEAAALVALGLNANKAQRETLDPDAVSGPVAGLSDPARLGRSPALFRPSSYDTASRVNSVSASLPPAAEIGSPAFEDLGTRCYELMGTNQIRLAIRGNWPVVLPLDGLE